jgi:hypothetical protein
MKHVTSATAYLSMVEWILKTRRLFTISAATVVRNGKTMTSKTRNRARVQFASEALTRFLGIPDEINITYAHWDYNTDTISLFLEGKGLPPVKEGGEIPMVPLAYYVNGEGVNCLTDRS